MFQVIPSLTMLVLAGETKEIENSDVVGHIPVPQVGTGLRVSL